MTSQGSAHGRFEKAIRARSLFQAELAAREAGSLSLPDALELVLLYGEQAPAKLSAAGTRWVARLAGETVAGAPEIGLAAAGLQAVDGPAGAAAAELLRELARLPRRLPSARRAG